MNTSKLSTSYNSSIYPSKLNANKKGLSGPETLGVFILVFLLVFGLIALYSKVMKGGTKVLECTANGGECVAGTCDFAKQIPALSDKAAGCKDGQLCCINITKSKPIDPLCKDKVYGKSCDSKNTMFCDIAKQCVSKCEFCSENFGRDEGLIVCGKNNIFESTGAVGKSLSCSCTPKQCADKGADNCIVGFCASVPGKECCVVG